MNIMATNIRHIAANSKHIVSIFSGYRKKAQIAVNLLIYISKISITGRQAGEHPLKAQATMKKIAIRLLGVVVISAPY